MSFMTCHIYLFLQSFLNWCLFDWLIDWLSSQSSFYYTYRILVWGRGDRGGCMRCQSFPSAHTWLLKSVMKWYVESHFTPSVHDDLDPDKYSYWRWMTIRQKCMQSISFFFYYYVGIEPCRVSLLIGEVQKIYKKHFCKLKMGN